MLTALSCEFSLKTEHMRTTNQISLTLAQRRQRHFSEGFRQAKVKELEAGLVTVSELCRTYQCSYSTVYWIFHSKFTSISAQSLPPEGRC
jgi:transposase-like protein